MSGSSVRAYGLMASLALAALGAGCVGGGPVGAIRPGLGVSSIARLSDYLPSLEGDPGDGAVYILDSGRPGATMLVAAGAHADEPAGMAAAVLLVERAVMEEGRLIIIPYLNAPALDAWLELGGAAGRRRLPIGSRQARSAPGEPAGYGQGDINRAYPGAADGSTPARIAAAVMEILLRERVAIAVDLHEAGPNAALGWHIIANPKNADLAALAVLDLEERGVIMRLEVSGEGSTGMSHREWGDRSQALAFLVETVNPAQDYAWLRPAEQLDHPSLPLWRRVGVILETLEALARAGAAASMAGGVRYQGLPSLSELEVYGLEPYF